TAQRRLPREHAGGVPGVRGGRDRALGPRGARREHPDRVNAASFHPPLARSCAPKGEGRRALARRGGVRGRSILIAIEFHPHPIARAFGLGARPPPPPARKSAPGGGMAVALLARPFSAARVALIGLPSRLKSLRLPHQSPDPPFIATRC